MKRYSITVSGVTYDVTVEELSSAAAPVATPVAAPAAAPVAAPAAAPTPAPAAPAAPKAAAPAGAVEVTSPLPGTVLKIPAKVGASVKSGEVLVIIEAMKMENEIVAPQDGKIVSIETKEGATVGNGDLLIVME